MEISHDKPTKKMTPKTLHWTYSEPSLWVSHLDKHQGFRFEIKQLDNEQYSVSSNISTLTPVEVKGYANARIIAQEQFNNFVLDLFNL